MLAVSAIGGFRLTGRDGESQQTRQDVCKGRHTTVTSALPLMMNMSLKERRAACKGPMRSARDLVGMGIKTNFSLTQTHLPRVGWNSVRGTVWGYPEGGRRLSDDYF